MFSRPSQNKMSQQLRAMDGTPIANYSIVFGAHCVACNAALGAAEAFWALDAPYHACIHIACAAHWHWPGTWPHQAPAVGFSRYVVSNGRVRR